MAAANNVYGALTNNYNGKSGTHIEEMVPLMPRLIYVYTLTLASNLSTRILG